jgi:HPr kinase/phosphorylase
MNVLGSPEANPPKAITVNTFLRDEKDNLKLEVLAGEEGLTIRKLTTPDINRPGLALAGFTQEFPKERIQILGSSEIAFLKTLNTTERKNAINRVISFTPPCIIITHGLEIPEGLITLANKQKVPVFRTPLETTQLIHLLANYLDYKLAPETYLHGDLVDVYGVGLLLVGESGIGKSECALDLVERGHRLVADDLIRVLKRSEVVIIGFSAAKSPKLKHHIEIRGVGIVDIYSLYGIRAIRMQKRIEVQVELLRYTKELDYERVGIEDKYTEILGVRIPLVQIPVIPGKNLALVCEVIAKNYLLKIRGYSPAKLFNEELRRLMEKKSETEEETKIDPWIDYDIE